MNGISLEYVDPSDLPEPDWQGAYNAVGSVAMVSSRTSGPMVERAVFHELLHGISGQRLASRVGLRNHQGRRWLNEAITELLANILCDQAGYGPKVDFAGSQSLSRSAAHYSTGLNLPFQAELYSRYKQALHHVATGLPNHILLRAYFAQDNDPFEADQRAGIHAERDLQRAIKVAGGTKAIAKLRLIDKAFDEGAELTAIMQAGDFGDSQKGLFQSAAVRPLRRYKVAAHTRSYQRQIRRAKASLAADFRHLL
jgi:hypothetical protein